MDASETLDYVRRLNSFEITLESGRRYTFILPDMTRFIAYGDIPMGVMEQAAAMESNGEVDTGEVTSTLETPEGVMAMRAMLDLYDRMLSDSIVAIDGQEVTMTPEAVRYIPPDDREELLEYLRREKDPTTAGAL